MSDGGFVLRQVYVPKKMVYMCVNFCIEKLFYDDTCVVILTYSCEMEVTTFHSEQYVSLYIECL